jgi:F-type H+-transporting ATPase subunit b
MNINLTLIGQTIMFAMFVWFCMKFVWPPIVAMMEERKKKIEQGLIAAERGLSEQKDAQQKANEILKQTKDQAAEIISNANKQASTMVEEAKDNAVREAEKIKNHAHAELEQEALRVRKELKDHLSGLVLQGVKAVIDKEVDAKSHKKILSKLSESI